MSAWRFSPTQASLLMLALATAAMMGVPGLFRASAPRGAISGVAVDERGFGVPGTALFLFDAGSGQLLEQTHADHRGRFAFQHSPPVFDAYARAPRGSGLVGTWILSRRSSAGEVPFVLQNGRAVQVRVVDERGRAVVGAEVRAYERRSEPAIVARARTDGQGRQSLLAPPEAHLVVFDPISHIARWRFDLAIPDEGAFYPFQLPDGRLLEGAVRDADGPLPAVVVLAWEEGDDGGWNGFSVSDGDGRISLPVTSRPTTIRALDPRLGHLPVQKQLGPQALELGDLLLEEGEPLVVHTASGDSDLATRVWAWCSSCEAWSWGARTDERGRASLRVSSRFALFAESVEACGEPLEAWDLEYREPFFELRPPEGRPN